MCGPQARLGTLNVSRLECGAENAQRVTRGGFDRRVGDHHTDTVGSPLGAGGERRAHLLGSISRGNYDGVIVTHAVA